METNNKTDNLTEIYSNVEEAKTKSQYEPQGTKNFKYNPYANLCGVRPYSAKEVITSTKFYNAEIEKIYKDKQSQVEYYKAMKEYQDNEAKFVKKCHKADHIKQLFSTLNFKTKGTSYSNEYEFNDLKKKEVIEKDFTNYYKKSFIKTYEDEKIKHKIIIRK